MASIEGMILYMTHFSKNPDAKWNQPETIKAYLQDYYKKHKEDARIKGAEWNKRNHEKKLEIQRKYRESHKDEIRKNGRERMALIRSGDFTKEEWEDIKKKFDYRCACCGTKEPEIKLETDHIVPISKGGKNIKENIQPLCRKCNTKKNVKIVDYRQHQEVKFMEVE